jgi:hypothetical protein
MSQLFKIAIQILHRQSKAGYISSKSIFSASTLSLLNAQPNLRPVGSLPLSRHCWCGAEEEAQVWKVFFTNKEPLPPPRRELKNGRNQSERRMDLGTIKKIIFHSKLL